MSKESKPSLNFLNYNLIQYFDDYFEKDSRLLWTSLNTMIPKRVYERNMQSTKYIFQYDPKTSLNRKKRLNRKKTFGRKKRFLLKQF